MTARPRMPPPMRDRSATTPKPTTAATRPRPRWRTSRSVIRRATCAGRSIPVITTPRPRPSTSIACAFTSMPGAPEPTGLTIAPAMPLRISGSSADVTGTDQFLDRDTYQLATDAMTNELSVLLAWPAGADLDYVVFQDQTTTETASSAT